MNQISDIHVGNIEQVGLGRECEVRVKDQYFGAIQEVPNTNLWKLSPVLASRIGWLDSRDFVSIKNEVIKRLARWCKENRPWHHSIAQTQEENRLARQKDHAVVN